MVFSYPAVYTICFFPQSVARWVYFRNGSEVPSQSIFIGSTLVSLCGLFDAILFFLTRPGLVIGTTGSPALPRAAAQPSGNVELPFSRSLTASDHIPLDVERGRTIQFQPYDQILHSEGAATPSNRHTSPWQSDLEDKEEYGHLPIR